MGFVKELDELSNIKYKEIFSLLKDVTGIMGLKILINASEILKKYNFSDKIEFILNVEGNGNGKMKYYFNGDEIKPDGRYFGVERNVNLSELLEEVTIQKKYNPDIKHLQIKNIKLERDKKLNELL